MYQPQDQAETRLVLPLYLVLDVSASMTALLPGIRTEMTTAIRDLSSDPLIADMVRVSIITFSDDVQVDLRLAELDTQFAVPPLISNGGTRYGPVFDLMSTVLSEDIQSLKADGHRVLRPVLFFVTDGRPLDPPEALQDPWGRGGTVRPNVVALGLSDDVDSGTLMALATSPNLAFSMGGPGASDFHPGVVIAGLLKAWAQTITSTVNAHQQEAVIPDVPGVTSIDPG